MPGTRAPRAFISSTYSTGDRPSRTAAPNRRAASSIAPPKRGPMVSRPAASADTRSFPARAVTMATCAPDTQGPWSAHSTRHSSMKRVA